MAVERTITDEELRRIAALAPPADDDVTVLADGTRLDTLTKILEHANRRLAADGLAPVSLG